MLLNLLLAIVWLAMTGDFTAGNLVIGTLLGFAALAVLELSGGSATGYPRRVGRGIRFALYFARELVLANLRVTRAVLQGQDRMRPAIVAVPLDVQSDVAIQLLAATITLTPGTLSLDVSSDRRTLYVHAMDIGDARDADAFVRELKGSLERRIKELLEC
jgi:multicomponent Na+:H+ antiporter subunit E